MGKKMGAKRPELSLDFLSNLILNLILILILETIPWRKK